MAITIDGAGRLVLPKAIRDQLHLVSGSRLEVELDGNSVVLRAVDLEASLVEKDGLLVHHGPAEAEVDVVDFLRRQREGRSAEMGA